MEFDDTIDLPEGFAKTCRIVPGIDKADYILVVDVSNLAWRSAFAYDLSIGTKKTGHVHGAYTILLSTIARKIAAGNWFVVFCYDGAGAKKRRQAILPEYKAKRDLERWNPCPEVEEVFRCLPGLHLKKDLAEGDDAIAYATEKFARETPVTILSGDKDVWALLRFDNVSVFYPNRDKLITKEDVEEEFGVKDPGRIKLAKALFGDSSDEIKPPVPRLRKAKFTDALNHPTVDNIGSLLVAAGATQPPTKSNIKNLANLLDHRVDLETRLEAITPFLEPFSLVDLVTGISTGNREEFLRLLETYACKQVAEKAAYFFGMEFYSND